MFRFCRVALVLASLAASLTSFSQADPDVTAQIVDQTKNHSQLMPLLRELTNIGARLTGSSKLEKAERWALTNFKKWGLKNVRLEKWGEFPVGFDRGPCTGRVISPLSRELTITSPAWSEGTHGPRRGPAVYAPRSWDELEKIKSSLRGAWIIYRPGQRITSYVAPGKEPTPEQAQLKRLYDGILAAGPAGWVGNWQSDVLMATAGYRLWDPKYVNPAEVSVDIKKSDLQEIWKAMDGGEKVELEFNLDHRWRKGPIPCFNVIAEIPGTEHPNECVILSGHLDSWDCVGEQGAQDNGVGVCATMDAARAMMAAHARPKRTLKFILWTGEEEGCQGSLAYTRLHKDDLASISAVINDDAGTNPINCFYGLAAHRQIFESAFEPVLKAYPDMPITFVEKPTLPLGASDENVFLMSGVPGFYGYRDSRTDYEYVHHTPYDRFETVVPKWAQQCATTDAVVSYYLACAPTMLPRK